MVRVLRACACIAVFGTALLAMQGCGESSGGGVPAPVGPETTLSEAGTTSTSALAGEVFTADEVAAVFRDLLEHMGEVPVFGVQALPQGCSVAQQWWPVLEADAPDSAAQAYGNPRVIGESGAEPEAQLVLSCRNGWMLVLQNFRGDLGEVQGEIVGTVYGEPASMYEVNGGRLVQWSYQGRWYGVFGRGVSVADLVSMSQGMRPVQSY